MIGLDALSVESATTLRTPQSIAASTTFCEPATLVRDVLERVVLGGVDLLERGGVHDVVDAVHGAGEPVAVADVADEPAQPFVVAEELPGLVLLELVAGEDHQAADRERVECVTDERLAEGPRSSGDQNRRSTENAHVAP
ncbi:hypothetical protein GCM10020220_083930 [Nonomuraea rubra]